MEFVSVTASALLVCLTLRDETKPPKNHQPVVQPIPFSHKVHAQFLRCVECHGMPEPGWDMTFPDEANCMVCHATIKKESAAVTKLAEFYKDRKRVPWVQIYKVPDYVLFSHRAHLEKAKIACEVCHGPVGEQDVLAKEKPTSMTACMACHAERAAPNRCNFCHNPNP